MNVTLEPTEDNSALTPGGWHIFQFLGLLALLVLIFAVVLSDGFLFGVSLGLMLAIVGTAAVQGARRGVIRFPPR